MSARGVSVRLHRASPAAGRAPRPRALRRSATTARPRLDGQLGRAVSVSADGSRIAAGMPSYQPGNPNVGAVDVFDRAGATWTPMATPARPPPRDRPETSSDKPSRSRGTRSLPARSTQPAARVPPTSSREQQRDNWPLKSTLAGEQMGDFFGWATAISADAKTVVVTAVSNLQARGAAYVFTSSNGTWPAHATRAAKLTASNPSPGDQLGESVAIDGNVVLAGAFGTTSTTVRSRAQRSYSCSRPVVGGTET